MAGVFSSVIRGCQRALEADDPQAAVTEVLLEAASDPDIVAAVSRMTDFARLEDLAIHRSEDLTLLAGALPPHFRAGPHNHNLWSVVSVCSGREDNEYFERDGAGLKRVGLASVVGPGALSNSADVIHAIANPLDEPLLVVHAYGGDLFGTPRSTWDPDTHEEIPFDWRRVRPGDD